MSESSLISNNGYIIIYLSANYKTQTPLPQHVASQKECDPSFFIVSVFSAE